MNKNKLKRLAVSWTLFSTSTIVDAVEKLGFVQIDPIRSPARAQDLILRHRVKNYHAGDIEMLYPELPLEEDYLYAYGYMRRSVSNLWHPRKVGLLTKFDKEVLEAVSSMEEVNQKNLEELFGKDTVRNWWGGRSRAAKHSLDILNYWGLVRVTRREKGQRIYQARKFENQELSVVERKKQLILTVVKILMPVTEKKLGEATLHIRRALGETKTVVESLVRSGQLAKEKIDGIVYLWVADIGNSEAHQGVRILAPFDPIVWDRRRFAHLWGWEYRFEAYVPASKRIRGYYAMPILWNENIIGWANLKKETNKLNVDFGFVNGRPKAKKFERELGEEIERLEMFLKS